jgi:endonuclease YncB( thermonuclease family)
MTLVTLAGLCLAGALVSAALGVAYWRLRAGASAQVASGSSTATRILPPTTEVNIPALTQSTPILTALSTATTPTISTTVEVSPPTVPTLPPTITPSPTYAPIALDASCIPLNRPSTIAQVLRVLDGVTIEVMAENQIYPVSYIGVGLLDFEQDAIVWIRAKEKNEALVEGKQVRLVQDRSDVDGSGKRPRYVLVGGVFVNLEMIRSGYAVSLSIPPDLSCDALFAEAQQQAILAERGLWSPAPTATRTLIPLPSATAATTGAMVITGVSERGTLWQEPEEFVEFRNDSEDSIQLKGWTLRDNENHVFVFPSFILGAGQYCRVYTNEYHPTSCGFSYYSPSPIWNNDGDCAYLKDPYDQLIDTFCYD